LELHTAYNEAMELAYFGAKVIHPKTMEPAISSNPPIPIYIRNTFRASLPGTRIFLTSTTTSGIENKVVCGFSSMEKMALINVEGSGLIGAVGVSRRLFGTLENKGVNVTLISQASSEHTVSFATLASHAQIAKETIEEEFSRELNQRRISNIDVRSPCSIIAAVGDGMSSTTGVAGRFFSALGDAKINVLAIAQGSSERNISAVVWEADSTRALRAVHAAFNLSHTGVRVGIVGMSQLGDSLLKLLETQRNKLRTVFDIDIQVCSVLPTSAGTNLVTLKHDTDFRSDSITANSYDRLMGGALKDDTRTVFEDEKDLVLIKQGGIASFVQPLYKEECPSHIIFDCTNDELSARFHVDWLRAGIDVITANNMGLSGPKEQRLAIKAAEIAQGKNSAKYMREVCVAGGLPIVSTLRNLLASGDKIRRIDGIFTVVLSYVLYRISPPPGATACSKFDETFSRGCYSDLVAGENTNTQVGVACKLSQALREAILLGLTEEDPTKDLNNEYTARVMMILAQELGMDKSFETELIQNASETLFILGDTAITDFQNFPKDIDDFVQRRVDKAKANACVLRQVSSLDIKEKSIDIQIIEVPEHHVFAVTPPSCTCVRFFTQRHMNFPLIIQGPSAGADSTASALLAELLQRVKVKSNPKSLLLSREGSGAALKGMLSNSFSESFVQNSPGKELFKHSSIV
jgi:aspartokinase/homoserine dehydrogenase 1